MLFFNRSAQLVVEDTIFNVRLSFSIVVQWSGGAPGDSTIKAYNLTQQHRNHIETSKSRQQRIILSAGYGGQNKQLYAGEIFYTESVRDGADIVTTFHMQPSPQVTGVQSVVTIFGAQSDFAVLQQCLSALAPFGYVKGHVSATVEDLLRNGTYKGFSDSGPASKFLDLITKRHGLNWNIHNLALNLFNKDEVEDPSEVLLSPTSGMIGFPTKAATGNYKVRSLLNAELVPGKQVRLESRQLGVPGSIKIMKVTHVGDTLEGDWYSEVESLVPGASPVIGNEVSE